MTKHVANVWKIFEVENMKEYHDLYLHCDVSLSADVFKDFRTELIDCFELDSEHYLSTPSYSWYAVLRLQVLVQI